MLLLTPQAGYNFMFGLWKYQWDADCELFLRILLVRARSALCGAFVPKPHRQKFAGVTADSSYDLQGEAKEDVYVAQMRLQEELEDLFAAIDKATGHATGFISKARGVMGRVGRRGGVASGLCPASVCTNMLNLHNPLQSAGRPAHRISRLFQGWPVQQRQDAQAL